MSDKANTDYIIGMVLGNIPDVPIHKIQAKINEFIEINMSDGIDRIWEPTQDEFDDPAILPIPDSVINIEFVYCGSVRMANANISDKYNDNLGTDSVYIGPYITAGTQAIYFGFDAGSSLDTKSVSIHCKDYNTEGATIAKKYNLAVIYFILYSLYIEAKDELAQVYYKRYQDEYNKLRNVGMANTYCSLGDDL